ncbi:NlpC/P60 family protein [Sediminimonas sp.]|uniref:C40 family peptidase n=1 Tax=Sediminimonas sp. TaxID=2823379 RepID=UPI0025D76298|nr:NlpC/P60 family protein [Sediminimonas sp.]
MTDRRLLKSNGRVADATLKGQATAARFVVPVAMRVVRPVAPLCDSVEAGAWRRTRELVLHELFHVLEIAGAWVFGYADRDGYVGYMARDALADAAPIRPTHVVAARQSYLTGVPELKNGDEILPISFGTALEVAGPHEGGRWAEVSMLRPQPDRHETVDTTYAPAAHLRPIDEVEREPVAVAERFIGTPYLWGGNSGFGVDCSGLLQMACLACGITCPGDSDQQEAGLGHTLPEGSAYRRGDLLFWKGHIALVVDAGTLIHANAHDIAVAYEGIDAAIARIAAQGDGPVTAHKRL